MTHWIIAIDGPAAAGKGTLARRLADHLWLPFLDTGLLYRAVGRLVLDRAEDPFDQTAAERAANALRPADLDRADLRGAEADCASSAVAAVPAVRAALLDFQRRFAQGRGAVLDGRDIGTVVFPNAHLKLFVTATAQERARRRWNELRDRGISAELTKVEEEIRDRDHRDSARSEAPLRVAEDAIVIDTTDQDPDAAFAAALNAVRVRIGA